MTKYKANKDQIKMTKYKTQKKPKPTIFAHSREGQNENCGRKFGEGIVKKFGEIKKSVLFWWKEKEGMLRTFWLNCKVGKRREGVGNGNPFLLSARARRNNSVSGVPG
jgi:hypothetical protein